MLTKTNDYSIQMINLASEKPATKKSAEPIESSLAAIQTLGKLDNKAEKSLAKHQIDPIDNAVVGLTLGLVVELAMLVSGVTSLGLVFGCTFGTMGVIWLIGILAGIYFQDKENQSRENAIEEQKSTLKELIAQNKEEITNFLTAKIENAQRERDSLLSTELPPFSETNNDRADRMQKILSHVTALDAIIEADNRSLDMLSKF